jgi:hypothetical protein
MGVLDKVPLEATLELGHALLELGLFVLSEGPLASQCSRQINQIRAEG